MPTPIITANLLITNKFFKIDRVAKTALSNFPTLQHPNAAWAAHKAGLIEVGARLPRRLLSNFPTTEGDVNDPPRAAGEGARHQAASDASAALNVALGRITASSLARSGW